MSLEMAKEWLKSASFDLENISYIIKAEYLSGVVAQTVFDKICRVLGVESGNIYER